MKKCEDRGMDFEYTEEEVAFLNNLQIKVGNHKFKFPMPEASPSERLRQRVSYRNEQNMYSNVSAVDGKPLISIFSSDKPYKIYPQSYWFSDNWDATDYGRDFDFNRSFFDQFHELSKDVPKANMVTVSNENSEYTTGTGYCKNCYILNSSENCEDCYYGKLLQKCKNIVDSSYVYDSEVCYQCFNIRNCYGCNYVYNSQNSSNCYFSDNLTGCKNCFLCTNLSNAEYFFMNKKLLKEEYESKIKQYSNHSGIRKALIEFEELRNNRVYKYANIISSENCSGDFIRGSKNCTECYDITDGEDCKYVQVGLGCKDVIDCSNIYEDSELAYMVLGVIEVFNIHFSLYLFTCSDILYCENMYSSKNCFGCSGMRNKQYCIFNKQYTKEEYEELVPKIIEHMQSTGEWGRFFPAKYSPFCYNETLANTYLPLSKEEALKRGYKWKDDMDEFPEIKNSINGSELPDDISEVDDSILSKVILCEDSNRPYRIVEQELKFYRNHNLPLPRKHPDVRHQERMKLRNERRLFDRKCMKCGAQVKTTFAEDRPETIYCEECYLKEVY